MGEVATQVGSVGTVKILLDTNTLVRLHTNSSKLGKLARIRIEQALDVYFSPLSIFELIQKETLRPHLVADFMAATRKLGLTELPLSVDAAVEARSFGSLRGRDPIDFLMLSQATFQKAVLLTSDMELLGLGLSFVLDSTE
jgi:PIN domain nuclease of toxin-antitoxin system